MECKNCGRRIEPIFEEEYAKIHGQKYVHYCTDRHSPNQCRQFSGHIASKKCYPNMCDNPEPKQVI